MHVVDEGPRDAPVLLLVHGFCGSTHSFDPLTARLATELRVVRVDLLGHGRTGGPAADAPEQARAVREVIEAHDLSGVTAVGHSFGADVAVALAANERVTRLAILAQAPDYTEATFPRGSTLMTSSAVHRAAWTVVRPAGRAAATIVARLARTDRSRFAAHALRDLAAMDPAMFDVALARRRTRLAADPLDAQVDAAGVPTLVVLGDRDGFYGARPAARYEAAGAQVQVLAGAGHSLPFERPDDTARLLRAFVMGSTA